MKDYEKKITEEFETLKKEITDHRDQVQALNNLIADKYAKLNFIRGQYQAIQDMKVDKKNTTNQKKK